MSTAESNPSHRPTDPPGTPRPAYVQDEWELRLVLSAHSQVPLRTRFHYGSNDPYAVHLVFHLDEDPVHWVFGRELLTQGMIRHSGQGDVRVRLDPRRKLVHLTLGPAERQASLTIPLAPLVRWLERTRRLVPPGDERMFVDMDTELTRLLATTPISLPLPGPHEGTGRPSDPSQRQELSNSRAHGCMLCGL